MPFAVAVSFLVFTAIISCSRGYRISPTADADETAISDYMDYVDNLIRRNSIQQALLDELEKDSNSIYAADMQLPYSVMDSRAKKGSVSFFGSRGKKALAFVGSRGKKALAFVGSRGKKALAFVGSRGKKALAFVGSRGKRGLRFVGARGKKSYIENSNEEDVPRFYPIRPKKVMVKFLGARG